jgi:phage terminase large subunit-like protein
VRRTPEAEFRTMRLNLWVSSAQAWIPDGAWDACFVNHGIAPGTLVVMGFDGSFSGDCTALVVSKDSRRPGVEPV